MAATYEQCVEIVESARSAGVKLAVNQNSRYAPAFFAAGELVRRGAIGDLLAAGIQWDSARGLQHLADFDAVHDVTVHQVDVVLSWFDREPTWVFADQTRKSSAGSVLAVVMGFDDGSNATIRDDFAAELRRTWPITIVGELGSLDGTDDIEIPEPGQPRMARGYLRLGLHALPGVSCEIPLAYRYAPESFAATMGDLLLAIKNDDQPWANGDNVLRTMRTLFAIERSIEEHAQVEPASIRR
jgi:predicted dehydrogenase